MILLREETTDERLDARKPAVDTDTVRRWKIQAVRWCLTDSQDSQYVNWAAGKFQRDITDNWRSMRCSKCHQNIALQTSITTSLHILQQR